jgi:hypothetical protein
VVVRRWRECRSPGWSTPRWRGWPAGARATAELARVAEAAARSDTDLAEAMDRLSDTDWEAAAGQLAEALAYDGDDPIEQAATAELRGQAEQVHQLLINHGLTVTGGNPGVAVQTNTGQIVQNTGGGTVHVVHEVGGDYHAGRKPTFICPAGRWSAPVDAGGVDGVAAEVLAGGWVDDLDGVGWMRMRAAVPWPRLAAWRSSRCRLSQPRRAQRSMSELLTPMPQHYGPSAWVA